MASRAVGPGHAASLMEDMTAVLAAAGEPLRLRGNDYEVYARARQAIASRLIVLPDWLADALSLDSAKALVRKLRKAGVVMSG